MNRVTIDRHIADPQQWWPFVAFVLITFASERAAADVTPRRTTAAVDLPRSNKRRRRDIRPPRAC